MSNEQPTPGSWRVEGIELLGRNEDGTDRIIAVADSDENVIESDLADFRRAAACVNACRLFTTTDLERIGFGPYAAAFDGQGGNDGVRLIALERVRQVMEKGWTAEHDDGHAGKELATAAFLIVKNNCVFDAVDIGPVPRSIPGDDEDWMTPLFAHVKQKYRGDPIRQLSIAGAMIAAEIDRVRRIKARATTPAVSPSNAQQP